MPQVNNFLCKLVIASLVACVSHALAHNGVVAHARPAVGIVVDGDLSDWPADALSYPIRTHQLGAAPVDTDDFDRHFQVAWDAATGSLWVAVDLVDDETILEGATATSLADMRRFFGMMGWRSSDEVETPDLADGCAILIDMGHEDGDSRTVRFGLDGRDSRTVITSSERDGQQWRDAQVAATFPPGRRVYEWQINLQAAFLREADHPPNLLAAGTVLGFDVTVADRDTGSTLSGDDLSWLSWGPGVGKVWGSRTSRRGDLVLIEADLAMGHLAGLTRWNNASTQTPPSGVSIRTQTGLARWTISTDSLGAFHVDVPAGDYVLTVEDVRLGLDRAETHTTVVADSTPSVVVLDAPLFSLSVLRGEASDSIVRRPLPPGRQRGVSWVGSRAIGRAHLTPLQPLHVDWIVQTPFGWQRDIHAPALQAPRGAAGLWGESDRGILVTTRLSQEVGIATLLKPHIWTGRGTWRGELAMTSEADWVTWFDQYETFILHYARLAQAAGIEALCIGTELSATLVREDQWRRIIALIRSVYSGNLTYAANWDRFEQVPFWDALDFVGVQAYFPLAEEPTHDIDQLVRGWQPWLERLAAVSEQSERRVLFTEIGYRSHVNAVVEPWLWPRQVEGGNGTAGQKVQAAAYEAFFRAAWDLPWVAGAYWWKWFPNHERAGGDDDAGFTPQNKPAQQVIGQWYLRTHLVESQEAETQENKRAGYGQ